MMMMIDEERMISTLSNVKDHLPNSALLINRAIAMLLFQFQLPRQALPFQGR
jgi:hypothetical protein